jgi:hypothetical protein
MRYRSMATLLAAATLMGTGLPGTGSPVSAQTAGPGEAWRTSPYHGAINGATGKPIPCICRFQGRDFRLGASVCMQTHVGIVITRCDLSQNNTSWIPTGEACVMSQRQKPSPIQLANNPN